MHNDWIRGALEAEKNFFANATPTQLEASFKDAGYERPKKVIIAGSRLFEDKKGNLDDRVAYNYRYGKNYEQIADYLDYHRNSSMFVWDEIVSGMARGVDQHAVRYALERGIPLKPFPVTNADWDYHGKRAGFIRNQGMADYVGKDGYLIAISGSKYGTAGTNNMVSIATKLNIPHGHYYLLPLE